jgi:hypothetical protein
MPLKLADMPPLSLSVNDTGAIWAPYKVDVPA